MTEERLQKLVSVHKNMQQAQKLLERFNSNKYCPEQKVYFAVCSQDTNMNPMPIRLGAGGRSTEMRGISISGEFAELVFRFVKEVAETYFNDKKKEFESL